MKVNLNLNQGIHNKNNVNFKGYKPVKSDIGGIEYEFNFPYDDNKYDCYLEVYNLKKDDRTGYYVVNDIMVSNDFLRNEGEADNEKGIKLEPGKNTIDLTDTFGLNENKPFGYHYKLYDKGTKNNPKFKIDAGNVIDNTSKTGMGFDIYNVVNGNGSFVTKGGAMKLVIPDNYNVSWVYDEKDSTKIIENKNLNDAKKSVKNSVNKIGGSLAGLEKDVEAGKFNNFSRIISTPIFTDDSLTAHAYWNKNCMQTANSLGNINNYASLQRKMFAKGINFVSDGAFVNEGLEGVHFKHVLKWGEKSPYFYWFRIYALQDSPFTLGIFGKNMTDKKDNPYVANRVVNSEYIYTEKNGKIDIKKNSKYNPKKPTYVQVYDNRLIKDPSKLDPNKLIESYDKLNTDNIFDLNTHNDSVVPYSFPINGETYHKNIKNLIEYNKNAKKPIKLNSFEATRILTKFENFEFEEKFESGIETWDANADIIKLNYAYSHTDTINLKQSLTTKEREKMTKLLEKKNYEVQDYAITSGQYWTKKTNQILLMNIAQNLKKSEIQEIKDEDKNIKTPAEAYYKLIMEKSNDKEFPKELKSKLNLDIVNNVFNGEYQLKTPNSHYDKNYRDLVLASLMDMPLDSVEFGDDIVAVLASPYITKRAQTEEELGMSRYDFIEEKSPIDEEYTETFGRMNHIYRHELNNFANEILDIINEKLLKLPEQTALYDGPNASVLGKYLLPIVTAEITKFAIIKSIYPEAKFDVDEKTGEIRYDYKKLKDVSLNEIGIIGDCPKNEANQLLSKIEKNMRKFSAEDKLKLTNAIVKSIRGTNVESYKLAEMIIDRTEAGLDWRIDATKDIADINALRSGVNNFEQTWDTVIDFWSNFNKNVLNENRNAYLTAEVTDVYPIQNQTNSPYSEKYPTDTEAERKLLNETGFTTMANYGYFFKNLSQVFSKTFEDGTNGGIGDENRIFNLLTGAEPVEGKKEFLRAAGLPAILYSYTTVGNHDVPRALHCMAVDMGLFYTDLTDPNNHDYRELAFRVLNDRFDGKTIPQHEMDNFNWADVSNKAVSMGDSLNRGFGDTLKSRYGEGSQRQKELWEKISPAIADLSNGFFKGKHFEAEAFGVKPFDKNIEAVIEQAEYKYGLKLNADERKDIINETFETIIEPAYTKLLGIMKYLVALPGNPTLFSGDELGATGYETKTKNIYLQNRAYLHNEWVDKKSTDYKDFVAKKKEALDILLAFRKRPELHALNDGAPFTLSPMDAKIDYSEKTTKVAGLLRQSTDGAMAISLFNTAGITKDFSESYTPHGVTIDSINLTKGNSNNKIGLAAGIKPGLLFANAYNKDEKFVVRELNGEYFLKKYNGKNTADTEIHFSDSTLVLYHMPGMEEGKKEEYTPSFTGRKVMYNPQYKFVSNPYAKAKDINLGSKLQLTSN